MNDDDNKAPRNPGMDLVMRIHRAVEGHTNKEVFTALLTVLAESACAHERPQAVADMTNKMLPAAIEFALKIKKEGESK